MSSNFTNRYVIITPEHTTTHGIRSYGTKSTGASADIAGEVDDESVSHMFDLMTRSDMSRYGAAKSLNGKEYSEGGLNLVAQPDDFLGMLLYGVYGDNAAADSSAFVFTAGGSATDPDTITMTEAADHLLPSFTLEIGREDKEHTYTGMCLSRLSLNAAHGEYVTVSADFNGKAESAVSALGTVTYAGAGVDGFHFANGTVTFNDGTTSTSSTQIKSISMEYSVNLDTDSACSIGSRTYVRQPAMQMREITGTVEFSRNVIDVSPATGEPEYNEVIAEGGLLYTGTASAPAIKLLFQGATTDDELFIEIHKVRWEAPTNNVSGRDQSSMSLSFVALVDAALKMSNASLKIDNQGSAGRYSKL
tara:strand:+ start:106 stop:1191 length:1086 start_codon:yes stop_codon:yes gene_type:complete